MATGNKNTIETQGRIFMGNTTKGGLILPDNSIEKMAEQLRDEKDIEEAEKLYSELAKQKQSEIDVKLEKLELIPMFNKVLLLPYPENPYRKIVSKGGIIVDYNGSFKNPDTGEDDKLVQGIACAKVIEVGPENKYVKVGDDVLYDSRTVYKIPFLSLGYILTAENQLLLVINEGLKERFKME